MSNFFRAFFCMIVALAALALAPASAQETCVATGDANCDGVVAIGDVAALIAYFETGTGELLCPYEVDLDGNCVVDYQEYLRVVSRLIDFPGWPIATPTCCNPIVKPCCLGDPNGSGGEPTIADITVIVDALFISGTCANICVGAADFNASGGDLPTCDDITISDISKLIECLFISGNILPCYDGCRPRSF